MMYCDDELVSELIFITAVDKRNNYNIPYLHSFIACIDAEYVWMSPTVKMGV